MTSKTHPMGHLHTTTLRGTSAATCRRCRRPILSGLDNDQTAFTAQTDAYPINTTGEALAILTGRRTYKLTRTMSGTGLLTRRTFASRINEAPAGRKTLIAYDVVAQHSCDDRLAAHAIASRLTPAREDTSNVCPF